MLIQLKSLFITGTDTNVGKTIISAGLVRAIYKQGINVGVMKPFAAAKSQSLSKFQAKDVEILARAAYTHDPEQLLNPQFFSMPASPYTASKTLDIQVNVKNVLEKFQKLKNSHDMIIVEGMGGIMTPILKNYFIADLIADMNLQTIIIITNKIGTINHTIMTHRVCKDYNISVKGIIINNFDSKGYKTLELERDIKNLTGLHILGIIPRLKSLNINNLAHTITSRINLQDIL